MRKQITSRPDNVWPDKWKHMSDAAKKKAKHKWAIEKPKLDNARQLRGIFFVEPDDAEFKHTIKNARGKLEIPMPAAMLCKTPVNCRGETCRSIGRSKTKKACVVDADETMRVRSEGVPTDVKKITSRQKGKFTEPSQLCTQVYSDASSIKHSECKGRSGEKWEKWRKYRHGS